jgi:hypothetical protein
MSKLYVMAVLMTALLAGAADAQSNAAEGRVLRARHATSTVQVKVFNSAGSVRLIGWGNDSIVVRGRGSASGRFYFAGDSAQTKLGIEERNDSTPIPRCDLVVYLPRQGRVSLKTVAGDITVSDVAGWFYTVSGNVRISGTASTVDVQSMSGSIDLDVKTPWVRARTGDGNLLVRGEPQDVDASTIGGTLSIASSSILRGQFGSVSGDVHYSGSPAAGAVFDFSSHSGAIDFALARSVSGVFSLSSILGPIDNGFSQVRPIATAPHSLRLSLGRGGAQIAARTFKGAIRLHPE